MQPSHRRIQTQIDIVPSPAISSIQDNHAIMGCLTLHRTALHQAASSCIFDAHHVSKHACACRFLHSWMAALQLLLVCFTMLALLGLVPLLYFLGHWYLAQQSPLEAGESPQRSLSRRWSTGFRTPDAKLRRENGKEGGQTGSEEAKPARPCCRTSR